MPPAARAVTAPSGRAVTLPGQGGVLSGIKLGDGAGGWLGDHVEPGASIGHPDPAAFAALRRLACVGNSVTVLDGPAAGRAGVVTGKHGAVLALWPDAVLARMAPGERVAIDAAGVGLAVEGEPDIACHSCDPVLFDRWIRDRTADGRLAVPVTAVLPGRAATAGLGMPAAAYNMDLNTSQPPFAAMAADLAFGAIVAVLDQDHRWGRRPARGWTAVGVIAHGAAVGGGHGLGLMTMLAAPAARLHLVPSPSLNLAALVEGADREAA